jgi:hypothetical protein
MKEIDDLDDFEKCVFSQHYFLDDFVSIAESPAGMAVESYKVDDCVLTKHENRVRRVKVIRHTGI